MTISNVDATSLAQISEVGPGTRAIAGVAGEGADDGASLSVSPFAQLLGQLQQLQQTDPGKLKTVLGDIAKALQGAAQQDNGGRGQLLSNLADRFQQASQTGDLSALQPRHHHHGHHHARGAAAYQQSTGQTAEGGPAAGASSTDPRRQVLDIIGQVLGQDLGTSPTIG